MAYLLKFIMQHIETKNQDAQLQLNTELDETKVSKIEEKYAILNVYIWE